MRPLTILAGANNSGKSSIMQPLLMMKQTLDATYDPGPLKLDGPNVYFTSAEQFLSSRRFVLWGLLGHSDGTEFTIGLGIQGNETMTSTFEYRQGRGVDILEIRASPWTWFPLRPEMVITGEDISEEVSKNLPDAPQRFLREERKLSRISTFRERCFLGISFGYGESSFLSFNPMDAFKDSVRSIVHVPAFRENARTYRAAGLDSERRYRYEGTFEHYVASIIESWQNTQDRRLENLGQALESLGLTWKVEARRLDDVNIELWVGRLPKLQEGGKKDLVNIADMGVGVSQVLPALVALLTAVKGQLVYLEHPERDLHPRAQVALAQVLADAAMRGVRVVVETHSSLLLLGVQMLVAKGKLPPDHVALHWFERGDDGATTVTSADLDEAGAFGDWPEDFGDVELKSESRYLDAAESVLWKRARAS